MAGSNLLSVTAEQNLDFKPPWLWIIPHTVVQLVQWHFTDNLLFVVVVVVVGFLAAVSGTQMKLCGWREKTKKIKLKVKNGLFVI